MVPRGWGTHSVVGDSRFLLDADSGYRYRNDSMAGYAKLFTRILDSTVWRENNPTRILWITMLALADRYGYVHNTVPGLADRAKISIEECEYALQRFQQPDKYSWSKQEEGRRIRVVDEGWFLINHDKFRHLMSADETREKTRHRVARWRDAKRKALHTVTPVTSNASNDIASSSATATKTRVQKSQTASSSTKADDDVEIPKLQRILDAYTASRVVQGQIKTADRTAAQTFLAHWPVEVIEYGILLGTARVIADPHFKKVRSLAYFKGAIEEASTDPNMSSSYASYLRSTIDRRAGA